MFVSAKLESELIGLDPADAAELLEEYGQHESGLAILARVGFETLGLQTYLTAGPKESRAWTIRTGATAPEAAGVIHTDFQKGFIKAEIVSYDDLVAAGSIAGGPRRRQGADRGQGLRDGRRRRRGVPLQRVAVLQVRASPNLSERASCLPGADGVGTGVHLQLLVDPLGVRLEGVP